MIVYQGHTNELEWRSLGCARSGGAQSAPVYSGTEHTAAPSQPSSCPADGVAQVCPAAMGLVEPTTVRLPAIRPDTGPGTAHLCAGFRRTPLQSCMGAMTVMVPLKLEEFQLQVGDRPEEQPVQAFPPNRADQAYDEGCENGTYGTVLISSTSRICKFACHWWHSYSRSWSELR
jgi:hypothetical protein